MNKRHHSNNILLNLGIENQMKCRKQQDILNDNNVLFFTDRFRETLFFITNIRNVTAWSTFGSMFNSGSFQNYLQIEQVWKMGTDYKVNVCYYGHSIDTEIKN
jgi:hypothetical protein